jgi:hypothetical protein
MLDDTTTMNSSFMGGVSLPLWLLKFYNSSTGQYYYYTTMFAGLYTHILLQTVHKKIPVNKDEPRVMSALVT